MVSWAEILFDYIKVEAINNPDYENFKFSVLICGSLVVAKVNPNSLELEIAYILENNECERIFKQNYYGADDSNYLNAILRTYKSDL